MPSSPLAKDYHKRPSANIDAVRRSPPISGIHLLLGPPLDILRGTPSQVVSRFFRFSFRSRPAVPSVREMCSTCGRTLSKRLCSLGRPKAVREKSGNFQPTAYTLSLNATTAEHCISPELMHTGRNINHNRGDASLPLNRSPD